MNKYEYIYLLKENLSIYDGNIEEIVGNYENIIDEMLDEGLTMSDISRRLGSPAVLANEIVEELGLKYNQEYHRQTSTPTWAKVLLIICGVVLFFPALGTILGILGAIFGFIVSGIAMIISGIIGIFAIWLVPAMPISLKILGSLVCLLASISVLIITYFIGYGTIRFVNWLYNKLRQLLSGKKGRAL